MRVFYYQRTVCVRGAMPGADSPIWRGCNTCCWMVPGAERDE